MITKDFKSTEEEVQEALNIMSVHEINLTFHESKDCFNRMVEESKHAKRIAILSLISIALVAIWACFVQIVFLSKIKEGIGETITGYSLALLVLLFASNRFRLLLMMCHYKGYSLVGNTFRFGIEQPRSLKNSVIARIIDYQEVTNDGYETNKRIYRYSAYYFWEVCYFLFASVIARFLAIGIEFYIAK